MADVCLTFLNQIIDHNLPLPPNNLEGDDQTVFQEFIAMVESIELICQQEALCIDFTFWVHFQQF